MTIRKLDKGKGLRAFSLSEMLVVLVIIGILVLIALPNLMPLISKAKAMEAQQQLASKFNKPNTVKTIGLASENIGGYMNDLVLGNSMCGGELNAIYVTASQDYYNVSIFVPSPKFGAVPIYYNYQVPFKL